MAPLHTTPLEIGRQHPDERLEIAADGGVERLLNSLGISSWHGPSSCSLDHTLFYVTNGRCALGERY
jgi:hypothetical protein